jgi:drug/metabolite transporter (DMT)-like permease
LVALFVLPLAVVALWTNRRPLRSVDWARLAAIGVVGGGIPFLLFFRGLQLETTHGGSITASFVYRTLFLMATVFGIVFLSERFHWRVTVAATLLLGGNLLLLSLTSPAWNVGSIYVFAATVLWAVEYTISKRTLRDLSSGTVAFARMAIGAAFLFAYLGITAQYRPIASFSSGQWDWVLVSALLLTGFVATWYAGLARIDLGAATAVLVLGFPITWLLSVAIRGTPFTTYETIGAVLVAVGAVIAIGRETFRSTWEYLRTSALRRPTA